MFDNMVINLQNPKFEIFNLDQWFSTQIVLRPVFSEKKIPRPSIEIFLANLSELSYSK